MKHGDAFQMSKRPNPPFIRERKWRKANFLMPHRHNFGAKRFCDLLSAETDTKRWASGGQTALKKLSFFFEEGIGLRLVGTNRTSQNDQEIWNSRIDSPQFIHPKIIVVNAIPSSCQNSLESSQIFKMNMTNSDRCPKHASTPL